MTPMEAVIKLKNQILAKRPILAGLFGDYANVPIKDYHTTAVKTFKNVSSDRKQEFISAVTEEVAKHFSADVVKSVGRQLEDEYFVSTAEHQGPFTHPFFVHSNLLAGHNNPENVIILGVGNVSLNNSSYPRGLIFHTPDGAAHQLPFFPAEERMQTVFGHRAYNALDIERLYKILEHKVSSGKVGAKLAAQVKDFINQIYAAPEILHSANFNQQVVKTNEVLWQKLFARSNAALPRLVTLQLEDVVLNLLKKNHLFNKTEIYELLFSQAIYKLLLEFTDGIPGNFSQDTLKGTFLFWHRRPNGKRISLWLQNGQLVNEEYSVVMRPDDLGRAIEAGELIPGTFLSLMLLSEYYGVKCLGGFSQGTYLTMMHQAYHKMGGRKFDDFSHSSGLRSDFVLAHFVTNSGEWQAAGGLDLALHHSPQSYEIFLNNIGKLTLEEAMAPLFPELYPILYAEGERRPDLLAISSGDIINYYGIKQKIQPCIEIKDLK